MEVFWTAATMRRRKEASTRTAPHLYSPLTITSMWKLPLWLLRQPRLYWETSETKLAIYPSSSRFHDCYTCCILPEYKTVNNICRPSVNHLVCSNFLKYSERLFSVKEVPALVFVIDTTGSMGEEIFAARRRTHSIIQRRASTGQPCTYLLVPFHDPGEGADTCLSQSWMKTGAFQGLFSQM